MNTQKINIFDNPRISGWTAIANNSGGNPAKMRRMGFIFAGKRIGWTKNGLKKTEAEDLQK